MVAKTHVHSTGLTGVNTAVSYLPTEESIAPTSTRDAAFDYPLRGRRFHVQRRLRRSRAGLAPLCSRGRPGEPRIWS